MFYDMMLCTRHAPAGAVGRGERADQHLLQCRQPQRGATIL
jgi:hypothetical protein